MPKITRRSFLRDASTTVAVTAAASPFLVRADQKNEVLHYAAGGAGGKGFSDLMENSRGRNVKVVALCDVDKGRLAAAHNHFKQAKTFLDWREMLDSVEIDAMNVSTPDHMHAPIAVSAMNKGIHVYCQKPMAHNIREARIMTQIAAKKKLVTQMGIQHHSGTYGKLGRAIFKRGDIGKAKEVHVWTDRPIWAQGVGRPDRKDPLPTNMNWDHWIGVAPYRPYVKGVYCPFQWRGWLDFGTGAMGDMGCHGLDLVTSCMDFGPPKWVKSENDKLNGETFPNKSVIKYMFGGNPMSLHDELPLTWYDGKILPPREVTQFPDDFKTPSNGALIVGEKGTLFISYDGRPRVYPEAKFKDFKYPKVKPDNHYTQWTDACHGIGKPSTPFDYSGPLTETVLLGNVALYFPGEKLNWDHANMKVTNKPEANQQVGRSYRAGWEVSGLTQRA